ncbi:TrmA [Desulforapulum autotrophicum HRM2]|uniref:TrmA n=1 Tax=Desulforapulum autotrophicum (strain ATCC 43914 / DSM 3382 / VKM B-1955 / HRM2) TaxID=177437 RepID=C0QI18_DESAH|nr:23S rRNA (uracil(1939)-C(5))-methyltransferase RlmD [Desulforapulum autotrophicum]ACN15754.1 TrmA [Desulforapulum autotrophicum HRM2]
MKIQKRKPVELEIIDLAFGGKGLAKPDGYPIFVDRTVPGDRIIARITKKKKSYGEATLVSLVTPSVLRQDPPCEYAAHCGGCRWQTLAYETQLEYKQRHVTESLEHIGLLKDVEVLPVIPSRKIFGFRNKMEFSCTTSRWLMPEDLENPDIKKGFGLGLHVPGTFDRIIDIDKCLIQPDTGNQIMQVVRQYIVESGVPAYGLRSHEGFWRFLMLRSSSAFNTWMVNIVTSEENDALLIPLAEHLKNMFPSIVSIVNNVTAKKAGIATGDYEKLLAGEQFIREKLGRFTFEISANSFFQTNTAGAEQLYSLVSEYADLTGNETVVDLYSGTGTIPIWLSDRAKKVVGIEIVESAVVDAKKNAALNQIDNCEFFVGDIKDVLPQLDATCNVMIIDPPRVGMHKDVVAQVMAIAPKKIVYVSCNPATLARDLGMLKERYRVVKVQPVDMFPHTFHIESVALLEAL